MPVLYGKQPPSGGCVLKLYVDTNMKNFVDAATFGWLCVETTIEEPYFSRIASQPPSGGCVLKQYRLVTRSKPYNRSHLRVAVC